MKRVTWVVDEFLLHDDRARQNLYQAIELAGANLVRTRYIPSSEMNDPVEILAPYIIYGTHGYIDNARKAGYEAGVFCREENLSVSAMMEKYSADWLLNPDSVAMVAGNIDSTLLELGGFHVRPDRGDKLFAGAVVRTREDLDALLEKLAPIGGDNKIMVSSLKPLDCEMRFIVVDRKIVAGCCNRFNGVLDVRIDVYPQAEKLAWNVARHEWQPDVAYSVDIAKTDGKFKIIELNSFSCAGFYACDLASIVAAMNDYLISTI